MAGKARVGLGPGGRGDVVTSPGLAVLTRLEDGRIRVDRADPIITISADLLEQADRESMVIDGDIVKFGDINPVTYRITERHPRHVIAEKVDTLWQTMTDHHDLTTTTSPDSKTSPDDGTSST